MTKLRHIDFWYADDCPRADAVRRALDECRRSLDGHLEVHEHRNAGVLSPTVAVDGRVVDGEGVFEARGCRVAPPSSDRIRAAILSPAPPGPGAGR